MVQLPVSPCHFAGKDHAKQRCPHLSRSTVRTAPGLLLVFPWALSWILHLSYFLTPVFIHLSLTLRNCPLSPPGCHFLLVPSLWFLLRQSLETNIVAWDVCISLMPCGTGKLFLLLAPSGETLAGRLSFVFSSCSHSSALIVGVPAPLWVQLPIWSPLS